MASTRKTLFSRSTSTHFLPLGVPGVPDVCEICATRMRCKRQLCMLVTGPMTTLFDDSEADTTFAYAVASD